MSTEKTIAAISTPPGNSGIGVIRVSGCEVPNLIKKIFKKDLLPREATLRKIYNQDGMVIDKTIAIYYKKPKSYTGEDMLEIHTHGNPIILDAILESIIGKSIQHAKPGEFTEKAFLNGKIDLVQAEAVSDLITSRTLASVKGAYNSLSGVFSKKILEVNEKILELRAKIESTINFPDDQIPENESETLKKDLITIVKKIDKIAFVANHGIKLNKQNIFCVAGQPNVGKSSLINSMLGQSSSIVSNTPGTTRDSIQYEMQYGNYSFIVIDTAGLRESGDQIEKEGMKKTKEAIQKSDNVFYVVDDQIGLTEKDKKIISKFQIKNYDLIFNKIDLTKKPPVLIREKINKIYLSAKNGVGMNHIVELIKGKSSQNTATENNVTARRRHLESAKNALASLYNAQEYLDNDELELIAEELRLAQEQLFEITGGDSTEELLSKIFSEFCIGK